MEYLVKQQISFKFTYFLMRLIKHFTSFSIFGVKYVTESSRKFFNFESVRHDLVLLLNQFHGRKCLLAYVRRFKTTYIEL